MVTCSAVLSTGKEWLFLKYEPVAKSGTSMARLIGSESMMLEIGAHTKFEDLKKTLEPLLSRLARMLVDQVKHIEEAYASSTRLEEASEGLDLS